MATGSESKIDSGLFVSTADTIVEVTKELGGCFEEWTKILQGLRGNWQGDTSDDIKNTVEAVQKSAAEMLRVLGAYKMTLYELAGIYDQTEKTVQEKGKSLKFDKPMQ
jgi:uncharacterized protein YukE